MEKNLQLQLQQIMAAKYDDTQQMRKSTTNRIRNVIFRKDKGLDFRELQEKKGKTKEEQQWVKEYTDAQLPGKIKELLRSGKLTQEEVKYIEEMFEQLEEAKNLEKKSEKLVGKMAAPDDIYNSFVKRVKGLNVMSMARMLYYFGHCENARYPSSLWAFAGLTPDSKHVKGESSNFNPKCRVEMFKIGKNLIRSNFITLPDGKKVSGRYRLEYEKEKQRQLGLMENGADNAPKNKMHADLRSLRKMVKKFLADYYRVCKTYNNEEQSKPWIIEKGGHTHFDDILEVLDKVDEV